MLPTDGFTAGDSAGQRLTGARLAELVRKAAAADQWPGLVRYTEHDRWYQRLAGGDDHEVWLLAWLPGQRTGFHDHCGSAGAFTVVLGSLQEHTVRRGAAVPAARELPAGGVRSFGPRHVHEVVNASAGPAVSMAAVETAGERW